MNKQLFTIQYLKQLCAKYGLAPSKRYGQNFLINPKPIEAMVEAAEIGQDDTVVEIGPGFGALTFALAAKAKRVIVFEIEKKLKPYWDEKLREYPNIELQWGNALRELNKVALPASYTVAANLPYQITSQAIRTFLEAEHRPGIMVFMVQKEVAERICAKPGDMSLLAVSVQYYAEPRIVMRAPRSYFWPEPAVDSAVIKIESREWGVESSNNDKEFFFRIARAGFSSKRKLLIKNLEPVVGKNREVLKTAFAKVGLKDTARAQELSVEQWRQLYGYLSTQILS